MTGCGGSTLLFVSHQGRRMNDEVEQERSELYSPRFICVIFHAFLWGVGREPRGGGGYKERSLSTKICCTFWEVSPL